MRTLPSRREVAVFVVISIVVLGFLAYGPPRFWGDFTGMTEAEARNRLGEPFDDSRKMGDGDQEYTLGWAQIEGVQGFFLTFKNGKVISQERHTR